MLSLAQGFKPWSSSDLSFDSKVRSNSCCVLKSDIYPVFQILKQQLLVIDKTKRFFISLILSYFHILLFLSNLLYFIFYIYLQFLFLYRRRFVLFLFFIFCLASEAISGSLGPAGAERRFLILKDNIRWATKSVLLLFGFRLRPSVCVIFIPNARLSSSNFYSFSISQCFNGLFGEIEKE